MATKTWIEVERIRAATEICKTEMKGHLQWEEDSIGYDLVKAAGEFLIREFEQSKPGVMEFHTPIADVCHTSAIERRILE